MGTDAQEGSKLPCSPPAAVRCLQTKGARNMFLHFLPTRHYNPSHFFLFTAPQSRDRCPRFQTVSEVACRVWCHSGSRAEASGNDGTEAQSTIRSRNLERACCQERRSPLRLPHVRGRSAPSTPTGDALEPHGPWAGQSPEHLLGRCPLGTAEQFSPGSLEVGGVVFPFV